MTRILLTGMSGVGKSSVFAELAKRGYTAIDADSPDYSEWVSVEGNPTGAKEGKDWLWREKRVQELLDNEDTEVLFISGCAPNMGKFFKQFDYIILLSAPVEVMLVRLQTRSTNPYGKRPEEVAQVLSNLKTIEPLLRDAASHEVNTSQSLEHVIAEILKATGY
jgi:dephospho-CoA kinase